MSNTEEKESNIDTPPWSRELEYFEDLKSHQESIEQRFHQVSFQHDLSEIEEIKLQLEEHPEEDLVGFNELYSRIQASRSRATSILFNMYKEKGIWKSYQHNMKRIYKKIKGDIFVQDENIKKLRNKELQEAAVENQLPITIRLLHLIDSKLEDIDNEIDMVNLKVDNLDHMETNLSRQQHIVESLIGLGYPVRTARG